MPDDVLLNKAEIIERCLRRVHEIYGHTPASIDADQTKQDALLLNLERACQAAIDAAMRLCRSRSLGIPKDSRDAFDSIRADGILDDALADGLKRMVGFRNVAVHDYRKLDLAIVHALIAADFPDLRAFIQILLRV